MALINGQLTRLVSSPSAEDEEPPGTPAGFWARDPTTAMLALASIGGVATTLGIGLWLASGVGPYGK